MNGTQYIEKFFMQNSGVDMENELKKAIKTFCIAIFCLVALYGSIQGYNYCTSLNRPKTRVWNSAYTEEEHQERVSAIVRNKHGDAFEFKIYTVYSFDDHPEYYLVVFDNGLYSLVLCFKDNYYLITHSSQINFWEYKGVLDNPEYKKYAGYRAVAYKYNDEIRGVYMPSNTSKFDYDHEESLTEEKMKQLIILTEYSWGWWENYETSWG